MDLGLCVTFALSLAIAVQGGGGGRTIPDDNCPVTIPSNEVCNAPCASGEYCRITGAGTRCCRMQLISFRAQGGIRVRRCSQMCVLPLKRPMPQPRPTRKTVRTNRPTRMPRQTDRPGTEMPSRKDCSATVSPPPNGGVKTISYSPSLAIYEYACNDGYQLNGARNVVCLGGQMLRKPPTCEPASTRPTCSVNIPANEQCNVRCVGDEYCRNTRQGIRCCRTTLINFRAQGGIVVKRCSQSCVLPPQPVRTKEPSEATHTDEPSEAPHTDESTPNVTEKPTLREKSDKAATLTQAPTDVPTVRDDCPVNIPANEQCDVRCVGDEYCRNTRLGIRCCRMTLIRFRAQGGINVRRCSESCVLPPRQPPQPVRTEEPSEAPHTDGRTPSVTEKPTPSEKTDESTTQAPTDAPKECPLTVSPPANGTVTTITHSDQLAIYQYACNDGYQLDGSRNRVCRNGQIVEKPPTCESGSGSKNCSVNIPANEQCDIRCVGDEYCRNTRLGIRCCRTTLINFSAQGGIVVRRCSESCVLPPRQPPQPVRTEEPSETPHTDRPSPSVTEKPTPSEKPDESTTQAPTDAPTSQCPENLPPPRQGHVNISGNIVGYRCNRGYRIQGNDTRECTNGDILGKIPKCKKANLSNGRCFVSHGNCTRCFPKSKVCSTKQMVRTVCPFLNYCRRVGSDMSPTCCEMNIDMFGRCRESCS